MINVQSSFCPFSNEKFNETKNKLALRKYIKIQPYVSLCHKKALIVNGLSSRKQWRKFTKFQPGKYKSFKIFELVLKN